MTPLNSPYWWEAAKPGLTEIARAACELPEKIETLIVGAGYSGLSAALTLARAGRDVIVIDAEMPGFGCSSRNGGLVGPSLHKLGLAGLTHHFGQAKAHAILQESMDSLHWFKSFLDAEEIDCGQYFQGRFRGAPRAADYETIARDTERLSKILDIPYEMVPRASQRAEIGSDYYHGGVVYHSDGHLHPGLLAQEMAIRAAQAGARIVAPAPLMRVHRDGDKFEAIIARKRVQAREVLIATNGYTGPALPWHRRRVIPIRSAIIATEELSPELMLELSPKNRGLGDTSRLVLYYRPSPCGKRMIFGGRAFDLADKPQNYGPDLQRLMLRIFPQLSETAITHAWSGTVAYTFDHAPHPGRNDGIWHVMGYGGSGVGRAGYFGHKVALKMLGYPAGRTEMDDAEFPTRPFYRGKPWFLPAVLRWNSLMDRLGK